MATVTKEIMVDACSDDVWDALRDFGALHERLVPGFVVDAREEGSARVITFFDGAVAREVLVGVDERARRLAYSVVESALGCTHHNASAQVLDDGAGGCRFVWIADVLPDSVAEPMGALMDRGIAVIKQTMEC